MTDYLGMIVAGIISVVGLYLIWNKKEYSEAQDKQAEVLELKEGDDVLEMLEEVGK